MCKFFGVSRSGYYAFLERMNIPDRDLPLAEKIKECQEEKEYSSTVKAFLLAMKFPF